MAIHTPGSRLYSSIPLRFIGSHGTGGSANANVSLNLTPFVDMMTILVTFLLGVFSAEGKLVVESDNFEFAVSEIQSNLQRPVPLILVSKSDIKVTYQSAEVQDQIVQVATVQDVMNQSTDLIPGLQKALGDYLQTTKALAKDSKWKQICAAGGERKLLDKKGNLLKVERCPEGLAILQADKTVDAKVITRIVRTAQSPDAGFKHLMFAAEYNKDGAR